MPIQLFVRTFEGKTATVEVESNDVTVAVLKQAIAAKLGMAVGTFGVAFGGKTLDDGTQLRLYNIQKSNTVQLFATLQGGL
jgi:hypothetical protein